MLLVTDKSLLSGLRCTAVAATAPDSPLSAWSRPMMWPAHEVTAGNSRNQPGRPCQDPRDIVNSGTW